MKNKAAKWIIIILAIIILASIAISSCFFVVKQNEYKVVWQFGAAFKDGLKLK